MEPVLPNIAIFFLFSTRFVVIWQSNALSIYKGSKNFQITCKISFITNPKTSSVLLRHLRFRILQSILTNHICFLIPTATTSSGIFHQKADGINLALEHFTTEHTKRHPSHQWIAWNFFSQAFKQKSAIVDACLMIGRHQRVLNNLGQS